MLDLLKKSLKTSLKGDNYRYLHSLNVLEIASEISIFHPEIDSEAIKIASLMHDIAKKASPSEARDFARKHSVDFSSYQDFPTVIHAPLGALILEKEFNIVDPDILTAVRYHTTGKAFMSSFALIVYIADYMASIKSKNTPFYEELSTISQTDLNLASLKIVLLTIRDLLQKQVSIHPDSLDFYNWLLKSVQ